MKRSIVFLLFLFFFTSAFAQTYEETLDRMARHAAYKLAREGNPAVAVYPFYEQNRQITELSRVVSEDFSIALAKYAENFRIIDRTYMEQMMEEHRLNAQGLIDPRTAKKFGMIIAADYYITGKINLLGNVFRLSIFIINTETGERLFSDRKIIPLNDELARLAGMTQWVERPDCEKHRTGDVCFVNRGRETYRVRVENDGGIKELALPPGQEKCLFELPAGKVYRYKALKSQIFIGDIIPHGQFRIEPCQTVQVNIP